ncbi:MAG: hypothetical protein KJ018_04970 [Burkholderiales bacterium]|nr:hypothetical protein [Burkholderiales bacterium]
MNRWMTKALAGGALALVTGVAAAQQCAGFGDVTDDGPAGFCPTVEWIKNRGITTGCQGGANYCPSDPVSRLAMAAFMQRLGKALSPEVHARHGGTGAVALPGELPDPLLFLCGMQTDASVVPYPRVALLAGSVSALADGNAAAYRAFWVYSTDSGANYQAIMDGGQTINSPRASSVAGQWSGTALSYALDVPAGTPLRVGIGIRRDNLLAGTTGNFANTRCQATVTILNANGATPPY